MNLLTTIQKEEREDANAMDWKHTGKHYTTKQKKYEYIRKYFKDSHSFKLDNLKEVNEFLNSSEQPKLKKTLTT